MTSSSDSSLRRAVTGVLPKPKNSEMLKKRKKIKIFKNTFLFPHLFSMDRNSANEKQEFAFSHFSEQFMYLTTYFIIRF